MTHIESAFKAAIVAAGNEVLRSHIGRLDSLKWRHHGLGMLQGELSHHLRIHIWHPKLRTIPHEGFRDVHDHRFAITSYVAAGALTDVRYGVDFKARSTNTTAFTIVHAKEQEKAETICEEIGPVAAIEHAPLRYRAGDVYTIRRRQFHTTRVDDLCITLVTRSDFDDDPARILGFGKSGIVPESLDTKVLKVWVLREAEYLLRETIR